jgi:hypothetical protein
LACASVWSALRMLNVDKLMVSLVLVSDVAGAVGVRVGLSGVWS